jgi:hypothetical protein
MTFLVDPQEEVGTSESSPEELSIIEENADSNGMAKSADHGASETSPVTADQSLHIGQPAIQSAETLLDKVESGKVSEKEPNSTAAAEQTANSLMDGQRSQAPDADSQTNPNLDPVSCPETDGSH